MAGLDRRGNWLWHATRVGDPNLLAAETTRTLPTGGPAGTGGKANEYGRVQLVAAGQPIDHELVYAAAPVSDRWVALAFDPSVAPVLGHSVVTRSACAGLRACQLGGRVSA
ncbi:MAG: hypothetical protein IPM13_09040 [Phycisphaerales bacterium]|nr:hypothetical protein [Phycisphaerales bacterium]